MTGGPALTDEQLRAWRLFLEAHSRITRRLEADLLAERGLSLATYDVLVQLVEAPDRRLRMSDLADRVLLSRSGLTRLVDRLEAEGLVERHAVGDDGRGTWAVLTDAGWRRLRDATSVHLSGVRDYALGRLDQAEAAELARLMSRMLGSASDVRS